PPVSLLFSPTRRPPPRSPPFPYPTLFRSLCLQPLSQGLHQRLVGESSPQFEGLPAQHLGPLRPGPGAERASLRTGGTTPLPAAGDRKSTRLNSSHLVISYAAFCLKKKKVY